MRRGFRITLYTRAGDHSTECWQNCRDAAGTHCRDAALFVIRFRAHRSRLYGFNNPPARVAAGDDLVRDRSSLICRKPLFRRRRTGVSVNMFLRAARKDKLRRGHVRNAFARCRAARASFARLVMHHRTARVRVISAASSQSCALSTVRSRDGSYFGFDFSFFFFVFTFRDEHVFFPVIFFPFFHPTNTNKRVTHVRRRRRRRKVDFCTRPRACVCLSAPYPSFDRSRESNYKHAPVRALNERVWSDGTRGLHRRDYYNITSDGTIMIIIILSRAHIISKTLRWYLPYARAHDLYRTIVCFSTRTRVRTIVWSGVAKELWRAYDFHVIYFGAHDPQNPPPPKFCVFSSFFISFFVYDNILQVYFEIQESKVSSFKLIKQTFDQLYVRSFHRVYMSII